MTPVTGTLPSRGFNVQSFRSNLVLRWEWRAGSTLYLVWQQDREWEETLGTRVGLGDMFSSLGRSGDNFFAIKASFWMPPANRGSDLACFGSRVLGAEVLGRS